MDALIPQLQPYHTHCHNTPEEAGVDSREEDRRRRRHHRHHSVVAAVY